MKLSEVMTIDAPEAPKRSKLSEVLGGEKPVSISSPKPKSPNLIDNPIETIAKSGGEFFSNIFSAIAHPVKTVKAVGSLAKGGVQKIIPGEQEDEKTFDSVVGFYKDRYGSVEKIKKTALEDPVGFASDLSVFLTGGGAAATKVGQVSKVSKLAKAGETISKIGQSVDPLSATLKGSGTVAKAATKGKKVAPFSKNLDPEILAAAKEVGIDLPASAKSTSRVVPQAESLVAKGFFGQEILDKIDNAKIELTKYADDVVRKTGQSPDLTSAGNAIFKGADKYRNKFFEIKNELYSKAIIPSKVVDGQEVIRVTPKESIGYITSILNEKKRAASILGKADDISYFQNIKNKLSRKSVLPKEVAQWQDEAMLHPNIESFVANNSGKASEVFLRDVYKKVKASQVSARELQSAIRELNNKLNNFNDPIVTGNKAQLKKLVTLMSEDLDNAIVTQRPELADALNKANEFYAQGVEKLNSVYGKKIFELADAGQYDKILPSIISKSTSVEDIPRIFEVIGKDNIPALQAAFLEDFFKGAQNADANFKPLGITQKINSLGGDDKLKALLTPEQYKAVKNIETISKSFSKLDKIAGGSQTAFLARVFAEMSLIFHNPWLALRVFSGDVAFSKFLASKDGQALLTEGINLTGKTGENIIKAGEKSGSKPSLLRVGGITKEEAE